MSETVGMNQSNNRTNNTNIKINNRANNINNNNNVNKKLPYVIVITGGIATGKSAVTSYLKNKNYEVFDSDEIVHKGYETQSELFHSVFDAFGRSVINDKGFIDRKKLSYIVLNDDDMFKKLNELVHKYVVDELMNGVYNSKSEKVFLDIPLMFEHKEILEKLGLKYNEIWLVYVKPDTQKNRLINRAILEKKDTKQVLKILDKQMPSEIKKNMADRIIYNEGTINELYNTIDNKLMQLT